MLQTNFFFFWGGRERGSLTTFLRPVVPVEPHVKYFSVVILGDLISVSIIWFYSPTQFLFRFCKFLLEVDEEFQFCLDDEQMKQHKLKCSIKIVKSQIIVMILYIYIYYFFLNVGPPKEDIFSGHLLNPIFQSTLHITFLQVYALVWML